MTGTEPGSRDDSAWIQWHSFDFMAIERRRNHESHNRILAVLAEAFGEERFSILDVGVLSTVTLDKLLGDPELDPDYVGVDISLPIIDDARRRHPGATWIQAGIGALPFEANSFDCVLVRHVLEHIDDPVPALREIARVARKMAMICFFLPPGNEEIRRRDVYNDGIILHNTWSRSAIIDELDSTFSIIMNEHIDDWYRPNDLFICFKGDLASRFALSQEIGD